MPKSTNLEHIRHSLAHLMAMAVLEKFPNAKLGIGPVIENGFYYDFDFRSAEERGTDADSRGKPTISETDLPAIEKRMPELIKQDLKFKKEAASFAEVKK